MHLVATGVLVATILMAAPAAAQDVPATEPEPAAAIPGEPPATVDATDSAAQPPLSAEEASTLSQALLFDPSALSPTAPAKSLRLPGLPDTTRLDLSPTKKSDGSATMVLKQSLANDPSWDAKVGADLGLPAQLDQGYRIGRPLPVARDPGGTGAAWATLGVPNVGSIDARVDPSHDQGKLGTTFKQSIPFGGQYALTLQNTFAVTESFGVQPNAPGDLPLMATPAPAAANAPQVWSNEKLAKFDLLSTGTSFAAGINSTNIDPVTHNKLSAEQKLFGPLHVTTSVSDLGQPVPNKSISAGMKLNW